MIGSVALNGGIDREALGRGGRLAAYRAAVDEARDDPSLAPELVGMSPGERAIAYARAVRRSRP